MNKEKIENFDKEQLELLLNDLQDIDKFTGFKNGAFKYELGKYQASLLVNYIKKQKEVIDKAIKDKEIQQKEFINYLEDEKDRLIKETSHYYIDSFDRQHSVNETIYDEVDMILQKYKEIIGDDKE